MSGRSDTDTIDIGSGAGQPPPSALGDPGQSLESSKFRELFSTPSDPVWAEVRIVEMSVAGLRFNPGTGQTSTPLETKSGSYIYYGDAASFHDWEFRTRLRIRLLEKSSDPDRTGEASPAQPGGGSQPGTSSAGQPQSDPGMSPYPEPPGPGQDAPGEDAHPSPRPTKSDSGKDSERSSDKSILVNKIIEGLRGDAFSIARDLGIDVIMGKGGLDLLVERLRQHVFPRAREEAKELFRAGQRQGGVLSRQQGESMLSYTQR